MRNLRSRIERPETSDGAADEKCFIWLPEVPLVDALAEQGWTLDDGPFLAIEIVWVEPNENGPHQIPYP